jgi:hypothetical protein
MITIDVPNKFPKAILDYATIENTLVFLKKSKNKDRSKKKRKHY